MSQYRRYSRSYPRYRYRVVYRRDAGCLASLKRFLLNLLTGVALILVAILFLLLLFVVLTHLSQVEMEAAHALTWITTYGPLVLLLLGLLVGAFLGLGVISALVKMFATISETLSRASLARARARHAWAQEERSCCSAQTLPMPKLRLRGPARRQAFEW
ncbi:MAG: hypothetical protein JO031_16515 [Ktedonobacteraceae bacterium]|nr:hypothetical protein [Ktedonobacteraceae bacterium]